jgi:anthranilate synthase component I
MTEDSNKLSANKQKNFQLSLKWLKKQPFEKLIGNDLDYLKIYYLLSREYSHVYIFESLELPRHQDRYFALGFDPIVKFLGKGSSFTIKGKSEAIEKITGLELDLQEEADEVSHVVSNINPYDILKKIQSLDFLSRTHQGGLIGYLSYEAVNYFESTLKLKEHDNFETFHFGLYVDGLIYDNITGSLSYYSFHEDRSSIVEGLLIKLDSIEIPTMLDYVEDFGPSLTKEQHHLAIENTLEEIRAGNTFQCEVGFKNHYRIKGEKIALYLKLRQVNPSPYMFYLQCGDQVLFGASPEILVACSSGTILTTPTAGTIQRGTDEKTDKMLARTLLADHKEIAEHNMLVDLHRNDLARVSRVGSVKVADLMYLIKFSHVQHIVSDVVSELAPDRNVFDLLAAILPGGVVSGAPKIETIKIINRNENTPRGPYGGAVGRFSLNGDCAFCLPIRSIFCKGEDCFAQTSSGVVYDSIPEKEYEELRHKLGAMARSIAEVSPVPVVPVSKVDL